MKWLACRQCWTRLSLVFRLMIVAVLAILLGGTSLLYITVRSMADSYHAELAEQLNDGLDSLSIVLGEQAVVGDYATIQQMLDGRAKRRNVSLVGWTDAAGKSLVARDKPILLQAPDWFAGWVDSPHFDGERNLEMGGQSYGKIFMRLTTAPTINQIWHTFAWQLQIILFGGMLFFVLSVLSLKYGLRPLYQLTQGAARFGHGDYSVRIAPNGVPEMLPSIHAFNDMADKIEGLLVSLREREGVLKESEGKLRDITSSLGEGIYMLDRDWRLSFMNPEAERLLGWPEAELLGKDAHLLLHRHPDGAEMAHEDCPIRLANLAGKTYRSSGEAFVRRDGSTFFVSLVSAPIFKEGKAIGTVAAFYDITERKQYESRLHGFYEAISARKTSLPEQIQSLLALGCKDFGLEVGMLSHVEGETYTVEHVVAPDNEIDKGRVFDLGGASCREVLRTMQPLMFEHASESEEKDSSCCYCQTFGLEAYIGAPIMVANSVYGILSFSSPRPRAKAFTDTDREFIRLMAQWAGAELERRQGEEALRRLNETLEQRVKEEAAKNREKDHMLIHQSRLAEMGEMIGNIAHQWRQPLNALGLLLINIQDAYAHHECDQKYLDESAAKGCSLIEKMSTTIDDFRNFFKPDREKARFSLEGAVRDALSVVEASFVSSGITVALDIEQEVSVVGFPNEYAQVLLNILGNAKDAILTNKIQNGRVEIAIGQDEVQAYVSIRDNGGGIAGDVMERIFDPYFTTREKGTGIGLYMSKMIIENNMSGRIEVRNTRDGAEFRVSTPLSGNEAGND